MSEQEQKCQNCGKHPAEELHSCPFQEEINDNSEAGCNCCADCVHECCMDI